MIKILRIVSFKVTKTVRMDFYDAVDPDHIQKERRKARELRSTPWWRSRLARGLCHYCGGKFPVDLLTMDHRIPLGRGGRTARGNVVVSCKSCNTIKKHRTPAEMVMDGEWEPQNTL